MAELTAITVVFMLLRHVQFSGTLSWGTDSLYALGIMMLGHGAATECKFVNRARREVRVAKASWNIRGYHTPSHIGFPPNECADVLALMGRLRHKLSETVAALIKEIGLMNHVPKVPVVFSLVHALAWTEVEMREDPRQKTKGEGV